MIRAGAGCLRLKMVNNVNLLCCIGIAYPLLKCDSEFFLMFIFVCTDYCISRSKSCWIIKVLCLEASMFFSESPALSVACIKLTIIKLSRTTYGWEFRLCQINQRWSCYYCVGEAVKTRTAHTGHAITPPLALRSVTSSPSAPLPGASSSRSSSTGAAVPRLSRRRSRKPEH